MIERVRLQTYYIHSSSLGGDAMKSLDKIAGVKINAEEPMGQLIVELDKAELKYRHVPLAEFRDQVLPKSGLTWVLGFLPPVNRLKSRPTASGK